MSEPAALCLLFTRRDNVFSRWIRRFTWSSWSHVAIVYGDELIESIWFHGVIRRPLAEALADCDQTLLQRIDCADPAAGWRLACTQVGKAYDYLAILGLFFRRDWQRQDFWQCAELAAWMCRQLGEPLQRTEHLNRLVPQHLLMSVRVRDVR